MIFQAYVPKRVELRVTVVGQRLFPVEIHSQASNHTRYDWFPSSKTDPGNSSSSDVSVYSIGFSGNTGTYWGSSIANDTFLKTSMMRWGNYDVVHGSVQWNSAEVPSGLSQYANPVPADHNLPDSLYLPGKPGWFSTKFGAVVWPPIGPDVTGGQLVNGFVFKIPAQVCYENTSKTNGILNFNAVNCYNATAGLATPTNLRIVR